MKNIQPIDSIAYEGIGFAIQNKPDQVSCYYRHGLTHTTGANIPTGGLFGRTFTGILESEISEAFLIHAELENLIGVSGGLMDNGQVIIFYAINHADGTRDIYSIKGDLDNNFGVPVLFELSTKLNIGFFYGQMITGDATGEYYHIIYQSSPGRYRTSIYKTTDYWETYSEVGVLYDGTSQISETAGVNLGDGKFLAISRNNQSGGLTPFESTNYGATWIRRPSCNLYWWMGGGPSIPWIYAHDGIFDIVFQCRDTSMIEISKGNTVANNFGKATPVYNEQEIYFYHRGTGGNPSLGYPCEIKLSNGKFFMILAKEFTSNKANLMWTVDDLVSDSAIPAAPIISVSGITATSFRFDITNYGDWQNVRYCLIDLSTTADFSTFVTCNYRAVSAFPAAKIQNIRVTGYFDIFNGLVSGTTYYLRIKGVNNLGESVYTIKTVTCL